MEKSRLILILIVALIGVASLFVFFGAHGQSKDVASDSEITGPPALDFEFKEKLQSGSNHTPVKIDVTEKKHEPAVQALRTKNRRAEAAKPALEKERTSRSGSLFYIQTSSFKSMESANEGKKRLNGDFYPIEINPIDLGEKGVWYRVVIGPVSAATKTRYCRVLEDKFGIKPIVREKK